METKIEFENDRVRVLRVSHAGHERHSQTSKLDRLIIYLTEGHVRRVEGGEQKEIRHKAGDVVWKERSEHTIENLKDNSHEVLIVEFKS
jgi:quercetin dioxygenase-like cupin family protein